MSIQHRTRFTVLALSFVLASAFSTTGYCQSSVVASGPGTAQTSLQLHVVVSTFVASSAANAEDAVKDAAVTKAEDTAIGAVAGTALRIPVIGGLPLGAMAGVFNKFRKHDVKGFSVAYLPGLSAETSIQGAGTAFTVGAQALQMAGQTATPILLRVMPSSKDQARIVRTTHVVLKQTKSSINPITQEVLATDQKIVSCHKQVAPNGDVVLAPDAPLEPGEYALVLTRSLQSGNEEASWAWDFRVLL